jgi:hypothetical protein
MKKILLFTFIFLSVISITASAKIRRVGYFGSPIAGTDYINISAAQTAATAGDTILMFPATDVNFTLTKKLTIIGPGNWLDPNSTPKGNANQQAFAGEATNNVINCNAGSDGSVIMGLHGGTIFIADDNITVRRNRDILVYVCATSPAKTTTNLKVIENYKVQIYQYQSNGSASTNMNISNNFISSFTTAGTNTYSGNISNNVWAYDAVTPATDGGGASLSVAASIDLGSGAYLFQNNILLSYTNASAGSNYYHFAFSNGGNTVFNYNILSQGYNANNLGVGAGNVIIPVANIATVFLDFPLIGTNSADNRYKLKANSPGLIANRPGSTIDAGMFGGPSPYKLSTIPSIPSIYSLTSPQGNNPSGNTIQINLSTRGNN